MVKIYIDPGHGGSDSGAQRNGLQEKNLNLAIARKIEEILLNEYEGVTVRMSRKDDRTVSLNQRTNDANSWGADFYLSIHINAGGGTGFESYIFPNSDSLTRQYQRTIHNEVISHSGFRNRGRKSANFHVLRETRMPALLTENGFVDHASDAARLNRSNFRDEIARGHAVGIAIAFQLRRRNTSPGTRVLYRVQIGAFRNRENAEVIGTEASSKGFNTYLFQENGQYKVQLGAFRVRGNAERLLERAKNEGFEAFIVQS